MHLPSIKPCGVAILKKAGHNTQKWGIIGSDGLLRCYRYDNKLLGVRYVGDTKTGNSEALIANNDQFIVSQNREIYQYSRKGVKQKMRDSPFDNSISHMCLQNGQLIVCSGTLCGYAKPNTPPATLSSTIVGMAQLGMVVYLGCSDGTIHSFVEGGTTLVHRLPAALTCMATITRKQGQSYMVVGCADTILRFFDVNEKKVAEIRMGSAVTAVAAYDFDKDGFAELLVALEDSTVCLINLALIDTPKVMSSLQLGFNVSNMEVGVVYSSDMVSAIVTSQTGHVGLIFVEPKSDRSLLSGKAPKVTEREIEELTTRVEALEKQSAAGASRVTQVPAETSVEIKGDPITQRFVFLAESERPITRVALSSSVPIHLYARSDCQTVIIMSPQKPGKCSAIVRPLDPSSTRLAFDFSYEIGHGGDLKCFVSFANNISVLSRTFNLKPFGLLKRIGDDDLAGVPDSQLGILEVNASRASSFREVIDNCLPTTLEDDEPQTFASGPIGSLVTVVVKGDKFIAKSIFFPIVVQLREFILQSMNAKKQNVLFETKLGDQCLSTFFSRIKDKMIEVMKDGGLYYKLQALQEVRNSSPMAQFGDEETTRILQDAAEIERKFDACRDQYEAYIEEIKVFYTEMWKKSNIDATNRLPDVLAALKDVKDEETLANLIEIMKLSPR